MYYQAILHYHGLVTKKSGSTLHPVDVVYILASIAPWAGLSMLYKVMLISLMSAGYHRINVNPGGCNRRGKLIKWNW